MIKRIEPHLIKLIEPKNMYDAVLELWSIGAPWQDWPLYYTGPVHPDAQWIFSHWDYMFKRDTRPGGKHHAKNTLVDDAGNSIIRSL